MHDTVGDFVLVAHVRKCGKHAKLVSEWTGPWQVLSDDREQVNTVEHIVPREARDTHVARMRFYADKELHVTKRMRGIFQQLEHQAEFHFPSIEGCKKAARGDEYIVLVR